MFLALVLALAGWGTPAAPAPFHFAILGDRTGEAVPGVYEAAWRTVAAEHPALAITVGDTIQGLNDSTAEAEWEDVGRILRPYRRIPLYLTPGNHDIWSAASALLFRKYAKRELHYSFDFQQAHFTVLDNSRSNELAPQELAFLEQDLKTHASQPLKFIISHRPSWIVNVALQNPNFKLHQLAKQYGVQCVIAGHVHQMLRGTLQNVTYLSMPSAGGHLRSSGKYEDGWFFGSSRVDVRGMEVAFRIAELGPPYGRGRVTTEKDWGLLGLSAR